jgi:hypothetical protein
MALNLVSPGVKIREVDLTIGRIDAVTDQVGAFAGPFAKGPVNVPVLVETEADLLNTFGKPVETDSQNEYWLSASSYLSYGGVLRVVRADGPTLLNSNSDSLTTLKIESDEDYSNNHVNDTTWEYAAKTPGSWANGLKVCTIDSLADQIITGIGTTAVTTTVTTTIGTKTGNLGITTNLVTGINTSSLTVGDNIVSGVFVAGTNIVSIGSSSLILSDESTNTTVLSGESFTFTQDTSVTTPTTVAVGLAVTQRLSAQFASGGVVTNFEGFIRGIITEVGREQVSVKVTDRVTIAGVSEPIEYKNPGESNNAFSFTSSESINVVNPSGITTSTFTGGLGVSDWYDQQTLGLSNSTIYWRNIAPKPGTSQYAAERSSKNDQIHVVVVDDSGKITGSASNIIEKYTFLSKASDAKISPSQAIYYKDYISKNSDNLYAGVARATVSSSLIPGTSNVRAYTAESGSWGSLAQSIKFNVQGNRTYTLSGGSDYSNSNGMSATLANIISAYKKFENPAEFTIDFIIQGPSGGTSIYESQAKANALIQIAEERKDCIACISPHRDDVVNQPNSTTQTNKIIEFFEPLTSSSYAVFDTGFKYTLDRFNNKFLYLPTNADVAGLMARTSNQNYSWFSPAGAARGAINNAIKLAYNPSQSQRDLLYSKRINPIIASPGSGIILFGDKTALGYPSAFDRINVRRLFLSLEKAVERAARSQLFEFNDLITRTNFINIVEPYLRDVKAKRGISEFIIVCDESNNTPDVIDSNQFKADIFVKPARSINYIGLTFVATRTGVSFSEVVGTV